jgi:hypothetical protein
MGEGRNRGATQGPKTRGVETGKHGEGSGGDEGTRARSDLPEATCAPQVGQIANLSYVPRLRVADAGQRVAARV